MLGLTDTQPEGDTDSDAPWHYGDPVEDGYYWCLCDPLDGSGKLLYWSGDHWEFSNIVMAINTTVGVLDALPAHPGGPELAPAADRGLKAVVRPSAGRGGVFPARTSFSRARPSGGARQRAGSFS